MKRKLDSNVTEYFVNVHEDGVRSGQFMHDENYVTETLLSMEDLSDEKGDHKYRMARAMYLMKNPTYTPDDYITGRASKPAAPPQLDPPKREQNGEITHMTLEESIARLQRAMERLRQSTQD